MTDDDDRAVQCSFEVARKVKNFLIQLQPQLMQEFDLDESSIDTAMQVGALRAGVYRYVKGDGISDDERRQLVQDVGNFINDFIDSKGDDNE